jgi:hypothetical protein
MRLGEFSYGHYARTVINDQEFSFAFAAAELRSMIVGE